MNDHPRGVHVDFCPACGVSSGARCEQPNGRKRDDHRDRKPECNGRGPDCNLHGLQGDERCICDGAVYFTPEQNRTRRPFIVNGECVIHGPKRWARITATIEAGTA